MFVLLLFFANNSLVKIGQLLCHKERSLNVVVFYKLGVDRVIEGGKIVGHSIRKIAKYGEKTNKIWSKSTVLIIIKIESLGLRRRYV